MEYALLEYINPAGQVVHAAWLKAGQLATKVGIVGAHGGAWVATKTRPVSCGSHNFVVFRIPFHVVPSAHKGFPPPTPTTPPPAPIEPPRVPSKQYSTPFAVSDADLLEHEPAQHAVIHAMPEGGYGRVGAISDGPNFSGIIGEDPDVFFVRLKRRRQLKNIDPYLWAQVGIECLQGTAGEWDRLRGELGSRFLAMGARDRRLEDFLHIVRAPNESLDTFVSRFQSVLGKAVPALGQTYGTVALSTLKTSIQDPDACVRILN